MGKGRPAAISSGGASRRTGAAALAAALCLAGCAGGGGGGPQRIGGRVPSGYQPISQAVAGGSSFRIAVPGGWRAAEPQLAAGGWFTRALAAADVISRGLGQIASSNGSVMATWNVTPKVTIDQLIANTRQQTAQQHLGHYQRHERTAAVPGAASVRLVTETFTNPYGPGHSATIWVRTKTGAIIGVYAVAPAPPRGTVDPSAVVESFQLLGR